MGDLARTFTYDDELHERRRRLALVRTPGDTDGDQLKRLIERCRDTRDP